MALSGLAADELYMLVCDIIFDWPAALLGLVGSPAALSFLALCVNSSTMEPWMPTDSLDIRKEGGGL